MPWASWPSPDGFPGQPQLTYTPTPATAPDTGWLCSPDMTHLSAMTAAHALARIADWQTALRAENKAPGTVAAHREMVAGGAPAQVAGGAVGVDRAALNSWIAGLLDNGAAPGTARIRQLAVRRFASWLTAGGEIHADPFPGVKAPRVEPTLVDPLTDDELRALIRTCALPDADLPMGEALHHVATRPSSGSCSRPRSAPARSSTSTSISSTSSVGSSRSAAAKAGGRE